MCGYYYSNKHLSNIEYLKRRGPEGWQTLDHEHGKFGHAMLNTIGTLTKQPYQTKYGILLYNGSTYNSKGDNDSKWLAGYFSIFHLRPLEISHDVEKN